MEFIIQLWKPIVEICILWIIIYHILLFSEGTRASQVLRGIIILLVAFFLVEKLNLEVLGWLLTKLFGISIIALLVIFHPEIRQGLARLGRRNLFNATVREEEIDYVLKEISNAANSLCASKIGALIAIEMDDPLNSYVENGVYVDARVSSELIQAVFNPPNPLHDGGMVLQHGRVMACGCLFPLTDKTELSRIYGTRHRAAIGLSEETDAVLIVVSEERQDISLVYRGKMHKDLSWENLFLMAKDIIKTKKEYGKN